MHENIACVYSHLNRVTSTYPLSGEKIRGIAVWVYGGFIFVDESFLLEWGQFFAKRQLRRFSLRGTGVVFFQWQNAAIWGRGFRTASFGQYQLTTRLFHPPPYPIGPREQFGGSSKGCVTLGSRPAAGTARGARRDICSPCRAGFHGQKQGEGWQGKKG